MRKIFKILPFIFISIFLYINSYATDDIYYYRHFLQSNPRAFERYSHVDSDSLLGYYTGLRGTIGTDTTVWPDLSTNSLDFALVSISSFNSDGSVTFDGTNDYGYQEVLDDETGTSFIYASNTTSYGFLYTDLDFANLLNKKVILTDGSGNKAWAYTSSVGSGLTLGSEKIIAQADRDFSAASNWSNVDIASYDETNDLTITANGAGQYCKLDSERFGGFIPGELTVLEYDGTVRQSGFKFYISSTTQTIATVSGGTNNTSIFTVDSGSPGSLYVLSVANGDDCDIDNISLKRYEDIPATQGCHVVTTYGGATKGWNTQSGFNFNDISSFQVIQPYLANITTAFTYFKVFTIDDGQPAADQALASEWIDSDGLRKWKVEVLTTGKIKVSGSSDGADNSEDETTDSAFFTDGAQSKASIMVTYDGTSYAIYGKGSLLASTTGAGGVPASLYDGGAIYTLNALGDASSKYDGNDQTNLLFNRALSADEGKRLDRAYRK